MSASELLDSLQPILAFCATLDLEDAAQAEAALNTEFPFESSEIQALRTMCARGVEEGWLCEREGGGTRFGRLAKPAAETKGFSIDTVLMSGAGIDHIHTTGEIDLGFTTEGSARFDGRPEGWIVYPPGSRHIPTVSDGEMFLLYFLPEGKVEWVTQETS